MYVAARLPTNGWQVIDTSRPKTDEGRRRYQKQVLGVAIRAIFVEKWCKCVFGMQVGEWAMMKTRTRIERLRDAVTLHIWADLDHGNVGSSIQCLSKFSFMTTKIPVVIL